MKKYGFTLAEVLITLGIIGVVAALTMPSLIANYKKHVYVAGVKKAYSVLNQGFKKMYADESEINTSPDMIKKYFKVIEDGLNYNPNNIKIKNLDKTEFGAYGISIDGKYYYILPDGLFFATTPNHPSLSELQIMVDINGANKEPNTFGRDIFYFALNAANGQVKPYISANAQDACGTYQIEDTHTHQFEIHIGDLNNYPDAECKPKEGNSNYLNCSINNVTISSGNGNGKNCAAYLEQNGWNMDY